MHMKNTAVRIGNLLKPGTTLSQRVARGGLWVVALRVTTRVFGFASTIILARILAPSDFGLFGIALLAMSGLDTFSQVGLNTALVQKKQEITPYLDTAWTFQAIRGALLAMVLFATAPYVAAFFGTPAAQPILQVIGLATLIGGFNNIGVIYFDKELEFYKQFILQSSRTISNAVVAILLVLLLRSVWALVFAFVAGTLVQLVVSYWIHPYRPSMRFNQGKFKELFNFGKWVLGSGTLFYLISQGDNIVVGKLLGVSALAFYQMAYQISSMPGTEVTSVISQVTFPAYAKLQADIPKLKEAYLKVLQLTAFLSIPITGLIFVLAPDFTRIFLGQKWLPMVPAMQILVFAGLLRSIEGTVGPILNAIGKPMWDTQGQLLRLIILAIFIYPLTINYGTSGTSLAVVASFFAIAISFGFKIIEITHYRIRDLSKMIIYPLISIMPAIIMIVIIKAHKNTVGIIEFILLIILYILSYLFSIYLFGKISDYKMWLFMRQHLNMMRGT